MPTYRITDPASGQKIKMTGDVPPSDDEIADAFEHIRGQQTDNGTMGSLGLPRGVARAVDSLGLGVLQGASELPGNIADLTQMAMNGIGEKTGLWDQRDRGRGWTGFTRAALQDSGILPNIAPQTTFDRYAGAAGRGIGGAAASGASGTVGLYGGAGSGVGSQAGADLFPESQIAPFIGGLLGGAAGGWAGIKTPAPGKGITDAKLLEKVRAGQQSDTLPDTMAEQADMMSEGGPAGPVRPPQGGATPEMQQRGQDAQGILNQLQLTKAAGEAKTPKAMAAVLEPAKQVVKPSLLDRVAYKTGTADPASAYQTAIHDAIAEIQGAIPGQKNILSTLTKEAAKHIYLRFKFGKHVAGYESVKSAIGIVKNMLGIDDATVSAVQAEGLKKLETIIRTGKPIPTKGTVVKNAATGLLGTLQGASK